MSNSYSNKKHPNKYTQEETTAFLESMGFGRKAHLWEDNGVDGSMLDTITDVHLKDELEFSPLMILKFRKYYEKAIRECDGDVTGDAIGGSVGGSGVGAGAGAVACVPAIITTTTNASSLAAAMESSTSSAVSVLVTPSAPTTTQTTTTNTATNVSASSARSTQSETTTTSAMIVSASSAESTALATTTTTASIIAINNSRNGTTTNRKPRPVLTVLQRTISSITDLNKNDVLCKQGVYHYIGNVQFTDLINSKKQEFITTKKNEKAHIAMSIVNNIRTMVPPGRFLKEDSSTGQWYDVGDKEAIRKTKRTFLTPSSTRGIGASTVPNENDVLFGRGPGAFSIGNKQFRVLIHSKYQEFADPVTKKLEQQSIATSIVNNIRTMVPPGRFLKEDGSTGQWYDVGDKEAIRKTIRTFLDTLEHKLWRNDKKRNNAPMAPSVGDGKIGIEPATKKIKLDVAATQSIMDENTTTESFSTKAVLEQTTVLHVEESDKASKSSKKLTLPVVQAGQSFQQQATATATTTTTATTIATTATTTANNIVIYKANTLATAASTTAIMADAAATIAVYGDPIDRMEVPASVENTASTTVTPTKDDTSDFQYCSV